VTIVLDARTVADHFPGIGRYTVNLAQALAQIAPTLDLVLLCDSASPNTRLTLPEVPRSECHASPFSLQQQWQVPQQLRRVRATLYHSPYYLMPYWPGVPTLFTCHDLIPLLYPQYFAALQRLAYYLTHALALRTTRVTIAVSEATRADLLRFFRVAPQRLVVIPEAAAAHFQPQRAAAIAALRAKYALPNQYVLYLGSNKPHKNLKRLVEAWNIAALKSDVPKVKLAVAGHWEDRYPDAKQRAAELGLQDHIIFVGPVADNDLPALYSGAMLFVFPSQYEGFGLPVLEAMACGTPVACSHIPSLSQIAQGAAHTFDPARTADIAEALHRLLTHAELRADLRQLGLKQAASFSWTRAAGETLAVYQRLSTQRELE